MSAAATPIPVLPGQILTEEDQEDILIQQINELIRSFLRLPNRRYPYHGLFRWTLDDDPNADFSVVMLINEPADLVQLKDLLKKRKHSRIKKLFKFDFIL